MSLLKKSSVCVVDAKGKVGREVKIASEPGCLIGYFDEMYLPVFVSAWRQPPFPRGCTGRWFIGTGCPVAGNPARESGAFSHDGEGGPEGCAGNDSAPPADHAAGVRFQQLPPSGC